MSKAITIKTTSYPEKMIIENSSKLNKLRICGFVGSLILFTLISGCTGIPSFPGAKPVEKLKCF